MRYPCENSGYNTTSSREKFELVNQYEPPHYLLHLDKLDVVELVTGQTDRLQFKKNLEELPAQQKGAMETSLKNRHIDWRTVAIEKYREVFDKYSDSYHKTLICVVREMYMPVKQPKPFDFTQCPRLAAEGSPEPSVYVSWPRSEGASAAASSLDSTEASSRENRKQLKTLIAAYHMGDYLKRGLNPAWIEGTEGRIELRWNAPTKTVEKIIKFMEDHKPLEIENDEEADRIFQIADQYGIEDLSAQCKWRSVRHRLPLTCGPDKLISPDTFAEMVQQKNQRDLNGINEAQENAVDAVDQLFFRHLHPVLQSLSKEEAAPEEALAGGGPA